MKVAAQLTIALTLIAAVVSCEAFVWTECLGKNSFLYCLRTLAR